jgi:hypothetical protein
VTVMRMVILVAAVLCTPASASAEWFVFPFAAGNSGGDTTRHSTAVGGAFGWMGGLFGGEVEAARSPHFFDDGEGFRTAHRTMTYTGTFLSGPRIGRWRPYGAVGYGLLRSEIEEVGGLAAVSDDRGALHAGGGLMWAPHQRVGLRADVRYIRALDDEEPAGNVFAERFAEFSYWRAGGGVVIRW